MDHTLKEIAEMLKKAGQDLSLSYGCRGFHACLYSKSTNSTTFQVTRTDFSVLEANLVDELKRRIGQ